MTTFVDGRRIFCPPLPLPVLRHAVLGRFGVAPTPRRPSDSPWSIPFPPLLSISARQKGDSGKLGVDGSTTLTDGVKAVLALKVVPGSEKRALMVVLVQLGPRVGLSRTCHSIAGVKPAAATQ